MRIEELRRTGRRRLVDESGLDIASSLSAHPEANPGAGRRRGRGRPRPALLVWEPRCVDLREPPPRCRAARRLVAFFDERLDVTVDGELRERPQTLWSREVDRHGLAEARRRRRLPPPEPPAELPEPRADEEGEDARGRRQREEALLERNAAHVRKGKVHLESPC